MIVITLNIYDDSYYIKYISTCSYLLLVENQEWTFHILCLSDYIDVVQYIPLCDFLYVLPRIEFIFFFNSYTSGTPEFAPLLTCITGVRGIHVVNYMFSRF